MTPVQFKDARKALGEAKSFLESHWFIVKEPDWDALAKRFWSKVEKTEGCWNWSGNKDRKGYGLTRIFGKCRGAHRVAIMLDTKMQLPADLVVMHRCDNPSCVRLDHLELGTSAENTADKVRKGRQAMGEATISVSKLTHCDVDLIRKSSASAPKLARHLNVSEQTVRNVRNNTTWKHVQ